MHTQIKIPKCDRWYLFCVRVLSCMLCPFKKQLEKESPWKGQQGVGAALGSYGACLGEKIPGLAGLAGGESQCSLGGCSPQGQRPLRGAVSRTQRQPNELPWDQRRLAKFDAVQKATELSKAMPTSKDLSPRTQWAEGRVVYETVSFSLCLMWSLRIFYTLKAGLLMGFFITCPFFSLKVFCLVALSFYRKRSRQIHIKSLTSFLQINHFWAFIIFIVPVVKDILSWSLVWLSVGFGTMVELTVTSWKWNLCSAASAILVLPSPPTVSGFNDSYRKCIIFPFLASVFFLATLLLMCLSL